jgi:hypothetical protein
MGFLLLLLARLWNIFIALSGCSLAIVSPSMAGANERARGLRALKGTRRSVLLPRDEVGAAGLSMRRIRCV